MLLIIEKRTIIELVSMIGGETAGKVMKLLLRKPGITDEEIALKLKLDVRDIRRILHRLNELGILHYGLTRDKVTEHRIFKWYVEEGQVTGFIITHMKKILDRLKRKLENEKNNQFYWCGTPGHRKYLFDEAMDRLFRCPECGKPLQPYQNDEVVKALEWKIAKLEAFLEELMKVGKAEEIEEKPAKSR